MPSIYWNQSREDLTQIYDIIKTSTNYSSEVPSNAPVNFENSYSSPQPRRYQSRYPSHSLTPTQERSPLQALKQTPDGLLFSTPSNR